MGRSLCQLHIRALLAMNGLRDGRGESLVPKCANHPGPAGSTASPARPCRNYQPKPAEPDQPDGPVRRIPLSNGEYALVDKADYDWLRQYTWTLVQRLRRSQ